MPDFSPGHGPDTGNAVVWVAEGRPTGGLDYGDRLVERLTDLGYSVTRRLQPELPDGPADIPEAGLHVLTGGAVPVSEESGWMPRGLALVRSLIEGAERGDHTLVGVCLGSQMIAHTLWPGCVVPAESIEVGLVEVEGPAVDAVNSGHPLVVPSFHYEQIDAAPVAAGGGEILAGNAHTPAHMFRHGRRTWGMQFHPELDPADVRSLVKYNGALVAEYSSSEEAALASVDRLEPHWSDASFGALFTHITTESTASSRR